MDIKEIVAEDVVKGIDERGPLTWERFFHGVETYSEGWLFRGQR
jgi:hypothetical protein